MACAAVVWLGAGLWCVGAGAAPIRWSDSRFNYRADGVPLAEFLRDLMATQGLAVNVENDVKGTVRGQFAEPARATFDKIMLAFGLVWFFDGTVVHISPAADMRERIVPIAPLSARAIGTELQSLGLRDARFGLRFSSSAISVNGPPRYLDLVLTAIERMRQRALGLQKYDDVVIRIFPLRHALAQDTSYQIAGKERVVPGVASLLQRMIAGSATRREGPRDTPSRAVRGLRGQGLAGQGYGGSALPDNGDAGPRASRDGASRTPEGGPPAEDDAQGASIARTSIVADTRTNSVVIYDVPGMMKHYAEAIALLDTPQELVEIDAAVIELSEGASEELGVNWQLNERSGGVLNLDMSSTLKGLATPVAMATLMKNGAQAFRMQLRALEEKNKARVLSRPRILTLNNAEAVIGSQKAMHVRVAGDHQVDLYPISTGLMLRVTPLILREPGQSPRVRLSIQIDDGTFSSEQTDGISQTNSNFVATQAIVSVGESLLIGGYHYNNETTNRSQIPVLGSIPLLGALFRTQTHTSERSERLFLITPRLASVSDAALSQSMKQRLEEAEQLVVPP